MRHTMHADSVGATLSTIPKNSPQWLFFAFHGNDQLKANAAQTFNAHNMQNEKHNKSRFKTV